MFPDVFKTIKLHLFSALKKLLHFKSTSQSVGQCVALGFNLQNCVKNMKVHSVEVTAPGEICLSFSECNILLLSLDQRKTCLEFAKELMALLQMGKTKGSLRLLRFVVGENKYFGNKLVNFRFCFSW